MEQSITTEAWKLFEDFDSEMSQYMAIDENAQEEWDNLYSPTKCHIYGYIGEKTPYWRPIETAPKDGQQFLATDGDVVVPADITFDQEDNQLLNLYNCTAFADCMLETIKFKWWQPLPEPPAETTPR